MPEYLTPGVYVEEVPSGARPIDAVGTSTAGFVGVAPDHAAHLNEAVAINNWSEFRQKFVSTDQSGPAPEATPLALAVSGFFRNGGSRCYVVNVGAGNPIVGDASGRKGLDLLEAVDEVAIVAAPGYTDAASYDALLGHCERLKDRFAILDAPEAVPNLTSLTEVATAKPAKGRGKGAGASEEGDASAAPDRASGGCRPRGSEYGAFYFPRLFVTDPLKGGIVSAPPSGHMAGIYARNDFARGVHKTPANEVVREAVGLSYTVTHAEQALLNPAGVNCIRSFTGEGNIVWGGRTLAQKGSQWTYICVRRLFSMVEESIAKYTRWVVFEPNDEPLWKSIRMNAGEFLTRVWRSGALFGKTAEEAFFVKCDRETNPQDVINAGQVVILIGMAPVKPAEFVIFRLSQSAEKTEITPA